MAAYDPSCVVPPTPDEITRALESYACGVLSLSQLCLQVKEVLIAGACTADRIHNHLDDALKARKLSIADYGHLVETLGILVSEITPTECAEETPGQSPAYRIIDKGDRLPAHAARTQSAGKNEDMARSEVVMATRPFAGESSAVRSTAMPVESLLAKAAELVPGALLRGRFRIEREVARSQMSLVFCATDLLKVEAGAMEPRVAVKLLHPRLAGDATALRQFHSEVANAQRLSHANIIHVFELDQDGPAHFITMEWLDGESLAELLDRRNAEPRLSFKEADEIIRQLCAALDYAHQHRVVHADIKPGNVFLTQSGELKLIDFGIAAIADTDNREPSPGLTRRYASCERLERLAPVPQDDLYSLACIAYRIYSGRRVFGSLDALEAEACGAAPLAIEGLAPQRWTILQRALALRRADRPATVAEFSAAFFAPVEAQNELSVQPVRPPASLVTAMVPPAVASAHADVHVPSRWPWILWVGIIVSVLLVGVLLWTRESAQVSVIATHSDPVANAVTLPGASTADRVVADATGVGADTDSDNNVMPDLVPPAPPAEVPVTAALTGAPSSAATRPEPVTQVVPDETVPAITAPTRDAVGPPTMVASPGPMSDLTEVAEAAEVEAATPDMAAESIAAATPPAAPPIEDEAVFDPRQPVPLSQLEFIDFVEPRYPRFRDDLRFNGWVDIEFRVGMDGRVRDVQVMGSNLPSRFEAPSIAAVRKWRFKPYEFQGQTQSVYSAVRLRYE